MPKYEQGDNKAKSHTIERMLRRAIGRKAVSAQFAHKAIDSGLRKCNVNPWYSMVATGKIGRAYRANILRRAIENGHIRKTV